MRKDSIITIDHEPEPSQAKPFGKRRKVSADASVTKDFFSKEPVRPNSEPLRRTTFAQQSNSSFLDFLLTSGLPLKSIAAVFAIALVLPTTFIAISERDTDNGIDLITTASIRKIPGFEISDVSMTRLIKNNETVVSVFGRLANNSSSEKSMMPLWVTLYDDNGKIVQSWQHRIKKNKIDKDQNFRFMTSAIDYSGKARNATVTTSPQK
ncbi:MAG: hypothetical protein WBC71_12855 [Salaquimonas sp.]